MATTDSDESDLVQEIAFIAPDVETTCNICHAEFLDSEDLDVHVKQVHEGSTACPKICQFCEVFYTDLEDYARHVRDTHLLNLKICRSCSKCFTDPRKARKHEKNHSHKSRMYACSQCSGLFTTIKELKFHEMLNHDNKYDGDYLRCMSHLSSLLKLQVSALLLAENQVMICRACDFSSVDLKVYVQHLEDEKCNVYVCDRCSDVFKTKNNLRRHFHRTNRCMDHKEYSDNLTTCPSCENEVLGKQLQAHLKLCRVYKCNTCNIRFKTIDELSAHQSEVHPIELDVSKCKYCTKEFVGLTSLEKHIERSHRHTFILYKYACKECDGIFKHPQNLFAHYYTKHKELDPYTCRICDMKFKIRKRFTIHIKLEHQGKGVVEFDDQYHVFFADKKSEKPFIPTCVVPELLPVDGYITTKKLSGKIVDTSKGQTSKKTSSQRSEVIEVNDNDVQVTENGVLQLVDTEMEDTEHSAIEMVREKATEEPKKKKRKRRSNKEVVTFTSSDEEEVEPLLIIKKRAERKRFQQRYPVGSKKMKQQLTKKRKQFTCTVCNKYCYTYQNYHNHIKIHSKNESIECVKCSRSFMTKKELTEHVSTDHATSKLIETLKSVLERKQIETQGVTNDNTIESKNMAPSARFLKTFKKVKVDKTVTPATITPAPTNLSVKKFIENFMPEITEPALKEEKSDTVVTIKQHDSPFYRKKSIKMTKFKSENPTKTFKLRMPEKFKEEEQEKIKLNVKYVHEPLRQSMFETLEKVGSYNNIEPSQDYDDYDDYGNDEIPDVAQEILLEGSEEPPKKVRASRKIVIPNIPQSYPKLHIATLQPQAPFFRIIKVEGTSDEPIVIDTGAIEKAPEAPKPQIADIIRLADGTKFVTANPLAHLLGDRQVENVLEALKNKHYKPARTNFKGLLTEALQNLDKPINRVRKPKKITSLETK